MVEDVKVTPRPALDVAISAAGVVPMVWPGMASKARVCASKLGAASTLKLPVKGVAAAKLALPLWLAVMLQVPGDTSVSTSALTVHTDAVVDANCTARPELAVAESVGGAVPIVWVPGALKVMVWALAVTGAVMVKLRDTDTAALKLVLPVWSAVTVQVPGLTSVTCAAATVQKVGFGVDQVSARPEDALATSATGEPPSTWSAGAAKVMVCAVLAGVWQLDTISACSL